MKRWVIDRLLALVLPLPLRVFKRIRFRLRFFPRTRAMLQRVGVFPIVDHYYDPLIRPGELSGLDQPRALPGIDFARPAQAALLTALTRTPTPTVLAGPAANPLGFRLDNGFFEHGDAELWFRMLCHLRPRRVIEVGCGHSTRVTRLALDALAAAEPGRAAEHVCIEPNPAPWLAGLGGEIIARPLETVDPALFDRLGANDVLFIDSSHVIRPQGDVLALYHRILPRLAPGVVVHVHDIFSPRDYLAEWVCDRQYLWNEQYLLEAFLSHNAAWEVLLGANMMLHEEPALLAAVCPFLDPQRPPRSFYLRRRRCPDDVPA